MFLKKKDYKITALYRIFLTLIIIALFISALFSVLVFLHFYYHKEISLNYIFFFLISIAVVVVIVNFLFFKNFLHSYLYKLLMSIRESSDIWKTTNNGIQDDEDELGELEDNIKKMLRQIKDRKQEVDNQNKILQVLSKQQKIQINEIKLHIDELQALYDVGKVINSKLNFDTVINLAVSTTSKIMKSPLCSLRILDENNKTLILRGSYGLSEEYRKKGDIKIGESIAGRVVLDKKPMVVDKIHEDKRMQGSDYANREGIKSFLCVPLISKDKSIGVITVYSYEEHSYSDEEIRLLSTFASQISIAIENARLYEETKHLAITDGLTGIYNHKYFREQLALETHRAERYSRHLSLIMIDVDNFKQYNDKYGHPAGDLALIKVAKIISDSARKIDIVARYGGEEFTITLPETDSQKAIEFADRVRVSIEKFEFVTSNLKAKHDGKDVCLSISAGISTFPTDAKTDADLINNADHALYVAKNSGKNRVCLFNKFQQTSYLNNELMNQK